MFKKYAEKIEIKPDAVKTENLKVLIADDTKDTLRVISYHLEKAGFKVITACDGEAVLEKVSAEKPDVIIMDIVMPKLDGISAARKLKSNPGTKDIPILIMSAKGLFKDYLQCGEEGLIENFIEKPFSIEFLLEKVKDALSFKF